ncbi:unnamed protein product, partial [Allacma fusca]
DQRILFICFYQFLSQPTQGIEGARRPLSDDDKRRKSEKN